MEKRRDPFEITNEGTSYLTGKLVGGYVSQRVADYLRLLAVYKSNTIQSILEQIIEEWMQEQEPRWSLIEALADRAYMEWIRRNLDVGGWGLYEEEVRSRLQKRKIVDETIDEILKEMRRKIGKEE